MLEMHEGADAVGRSDAIGHRQPKDAGDAPSRTQMSWKGVGIFWNATKSMGACWSQPPVSVHVL
jgi:hypothetical protein